MEQLFLQVLNMSLTASYVIVFVMIVRLCLKKSPKIFSYGLWSVVFFRLVCPFSFESLYSLLPQRAEVIPSDIMYAQTPQINSGIASVDQVINSILPPATPTASVNPIQIWITIGAIVWVIGILVLFLYSLVTVRRLHRHLQSVEELSNGIYEVQGLQTPFVFGLIKPSIYLPTGLSIHERSYILTHEKTHIRRFDHIIKPIAFIVLCIHWFNPLVWISFLLMSEDMELSCDERVIKELGSNIKKDYATSLLALSTGRRIIGGCPLAFGENDTRSRIKNILNYKKLTFWGALILVIAVGIIGIGLISNPKSEDIDNLMTLVMNQEQIKVHQMEHSGFTYLSGQELGKWMESVTWKEKKVSSPYELSATYIIENLRGDGSRSEVHLYESEPTLARVFYEESWKYYQIDSDAYNNFKFLVVTRNYFEEYTKSSTISATLREYKSGTYVTEGEINDEIATNKLVNLLNQGILTYKQSIQDMPQIEDYIQIIIEALEEVNIYYYYEEEDVHYIERPYVGIYKISDTVAEGIKGILSSSSEKVNLDENTSISIEDRLTSLFETLMSSSKAYNDPSDYIRANPDVFEEIVSYGDRTLVYCYNLFEKRGQTGLKGQLMMAACRTLVVDEDIDIVARTGEEWYDDFRENAMQLSIRLGQNEFEKTMPKSYLLLRVLQNRIGDRANQILLPNYKYTGEDELLKLVYETELTYYQPVEGFAIVAPHIFGSYEEGNRLKVFATIYDATYCLYDKEVVNVNGSIAPVALTYIKNSDGTYTLENYEMAKDGSLFQSSIEEYCIMPVSGEKINGLADEIMRHYSDYSDLQWLQLENLKEHLESYNQLGVSLVTGDDIIGTPLT